VSRTERVGVAAGRASTPWTNNCVAASKLTNYQGLQKYASSKSYRQSLSNLLALFRDLSETKVTGSCGVKHI
jgi:hypothetical protein